MLRGCVLWNTLSASRMLHGCVLWNTLSASPMLYGCVLWNALSASLGRPALFETSHINGRGDKRTNNKTMRLDTKNNGAAIYLGAVKMCHYMILVL